MLDLNDIIRSRVGRELPGCVVRRLERLLHIEDINDILTAGQGLCRRSFCGMCFSDWMFAAILDKRHGSMMIDIYSLQITLSGRWTV